MTYKIIQVYIRNEQYNYNHYINEYNENKQLTLSTNMSTFKLQISFIYYAAILEDGDKE